MCLSLELLMENSSARIVKQTNQNLGFGLVVRASKTWLFIILVLLPKSLLACRGPGWSPPDDPFLGPNMTMINDSFTSYTAHTDDEMRINLTGIKDLMNRNIKAAWNGWEPTDQVQRDWRNWYSEWKIENEKNDDPDQPGVSDDKRGLGSGWPKLPGWGDLGMGNPGDPVPPWAYVPRNIGRPSICYLPPVVGQCRKKEIKGEEGIRYGFNPYTDQCEEYYWSGCGGTRNKFTTKERCEEHCKVDPPQACTAVSPVQDKLGHQFDKELKKDN